MHNRFRRRYAVLLTAAALLVGLGWGAVHVHSSLIDPYKPAPITPVTSVTYLAPGFKITNVATFPEEVSSLLASRANHNLVDSSIFVGTTPIGGVHRFDPSSAHRIYQTLAIGMGDMIKSGNCNVNALAVRDFDGDGKPDLLASTSQVYPRGVPRLYYWNLGVPSSLREIARPKIASSWSHGLGFLTNPDDKSTSAFITYCGFGEIVEFRFENSSNSMGFVQESLNWKQVGQLPTSGEWLETADVDNDGSTDLCISTGFAEGKAAMMFYSRDSVGGLSLRHKIDEGGRFGNVHFAVGDASGTGTNDLIAWWCTEIDGGDCEMVRYRLTSKGVMERAPILSTTADEIMPRDGQIAFHDLDRDGRLEVWFGSRSGSIWRYDPARSEIVTRVMTQIGSIGPLIGMDHPNRGSASGIYFGQGSDVLHISATD